MGSNLFDHVARAKKYGKKNPTIRRAAKKLEDAVNRYTDRRINKWSLDKAFKKFEEEAGRQIIEEFNRSNGQAKRLGASSRSNQFVRQLTSGLGHVGKIISDIFSKKTNGFTEREVRATTALMRMQPIQSVANDQAFNKIVQAAVDSLEDHNWSVSATVATAKQASETYLKDPSQHLEKIEKPGPEFKESVHQSGRQKVIDGANTPRLSKVHRTPSSSNVYSFQYDYLTTTLYVQFKAPTINQKSVTNYTHKGGIRGMAGDMGKTVTGKTDDPGQLYAYYDVPIRVFKKLKTATSAGKAVWDLLRVRGSIDGHQYRYSLVAGVMVAGEDGQMAMYVSRRAVGKGFQSRSVATPGAGKRRYVSSTLPQDLRGHGTISANRHRPPRGRPLLPNRGRPNPPNRGR